jgi:5-methyltetrahydropteroyltriglutamate--homocysteine methyltransferase
VISHAAPPTTLLPTTVVGSYPQPDWLLDHAALSGLVPRVRMPELWRVAPEFLAGAQDDATLLAIRDMERAGIDIVSDGEVRRESYSSAFATALDGIDTAHTAVIRNSAGREVRVPRVVGPIRRRGPVEERNVAFLRANTEHAIKVALPGPFTPSARSSATSRPPEPT